jgi:UrcA family protein
MTNFTAKLAGVATLALAALPAIALSSAAHAAPAPVAIKIADLDLSSRAGLGVFHRRAREAGAQMCRDERALAARESCEHAVVAEAREKLAQHLSRRSAPAVPTALAAAR